MGLPAASRRTTARAVSRIGRINTANAAMRLVRFGIIDRMVLTPVEIIGYLLYAIIAGAVLFFWGGWAATVMVVLAITGGAVLFPVLLPWLPTRDFTTKGWSLGIVVTLGVLLVNMLVFGTDATVGHRVLSVVSNLLIWPPVTAYIALNFTGASTFTSRSGVKAEMRSYIRPLAVSFALGIILNVIAKFV